MDLTPFQMRLLVALHGHAGWLVVALLAHPVVLLRTDGRKAPWSVGLATTSVTAVALAGGWLYVRYRALVRTDLFRSAPGVGWLFERKEHLALGAVLFAWTGAAAYLAARRRADERAAWRRVARGSFAVATLLAACVAAFGTWVTATRSFP
ncbi:MAG: hypothetical protein U0169_16470 [Polyangiaceae bacterium]